MIHYAESASSGPRPRPAPVMADSPPAALVTGAGGGMGRAIAERLSARGSRVLAADLKPRPGDLDPAITYVAADLTETGAIDGLLASPVLDGSLDYLVNAAGVALWGRDGSALDMAEDAWRDVLAVNFDATRRLTVKSVPLLRRRTGRSVVNIASIGGLRNMDSPFDAYQVSKAAVVSFTRSLAEHLGPRHPVRYRVPRRHPHADHRVPLYRVSRSGGPGWRSGPRCAGLGTPHDIACAVTFLLSEQRLVHHRHRPRSWTAAGSSRPSKYTCPALRQVIGRHDLHGGWRNGKIRQGPCACMMTWQARRMSCRRSWCSTAESRPAAQQPDVVVRRGRGRRRPAHVAAAARRTRRASAVLPPPIE